MFGNRIISPYASYGLGSVARSGINWSSLLSNTQKTLGIINQAIPAFYQIKPIFNNMKTMFRVVNEINKDDNINNNRKQTVDDNNFNDSQSINQMTSYTIEDDGPNFFV